MSCVVSLNFYKLSLSILAFQFLCSVTLYAVGPDDWCLSSVDSLDVDWRAMRHLLPDCRPSSSRDSLAGSEECDEEAKLFGDQVFKMLVPLDAQIGSLTHDTVLRVINALILVAPESREEFIDLIIGLKFFGRSHPSHGGSYSVEVALDYLANLAMTYPHAIRMYELFACYQLAGLTPHMIMRVVDVLVLVEPRHRDAFVKLVGEEKIFDPSHLLHKKGYNLEAALRNSGSLAMTYGPARLSSAPSFLLNSPSSPPPPEHLAWLSVL